MLGVLSNTHRKKRNGSSTKLSSALVAVTGNSADVPAVRLACEMLNKQDGKLYLLYVIVVERGVPLDAEITPATAKGEDVLRHLEEVAREYRCEMAAELLQSRQSGPAIVQEAVDKEAGAIILGIPYLEKYGTFSMGESAPYVLKNAPCRVILWRDSPQINEATVATSLQTE